MDDKTSFHIFAAIFYWNGYDLRVIDIVPNRGFGYVSLERRVYTVAYTTKITRTLPLYSTYTATSTKTYTLTEKVPLAHRYSWLPYVFVATALSAVVLALALELERRKPTPKAEGTGLVKLCPVCGVELPLKAECCYERGTKLA
ncbi:MAG: hypothetical protein ACP5K1_06435 [Candidatus Bathyarchaeia archaeon]